MSTNAPDILSVITAHIGDAGTGWSVGSFGAIAEFVRDAAEPAAIIRSASSVSATTDRGGIFLNVVEGLRLVASEGVTKESWSQRVALCLASEASAMSRRNVITELGVDEAALRERDRASTLFDLGLGTQQVDACIRVSDPAATKEIRGCCGHSLFEHGNPAMGVILAVQPHRVFISRIGRAEVFQPIPPPDGKSPEGPHTHVLPKLLRNGLTHAATEPVPDGLVPCAHFYPSHPSKDAMGVPRSYDPTLYYAFQKLFGAYGDPALVNLKAQMIRAVSTGEDPSGFTVPSHRFARATIRVGLRQMAAAGVGGSLPRWQSLHDRHHHHDESEAEAGSLHGH